MEIRGGVESTPHTSWIFKTPYNSEREENEFQCTRVVSILYSRQRDEI